MLQKMSKIFAVAMMKNLHTSEMPVRKKITVPPDDPRNRPEANTSDP